MVKPCTNHHIIDTSRTPDVELCAPRSDRDDYKQTANIDFEPENIADLFAFWKSSYKKGRNDAFQIVEDPATPWFLRGTVFVNHVARLSVRKNGFAGDFDQNPDENGIRTSRSELSENFSAEQNQTYWYSFRTYIPKDFPIEQNRCVIAQWHASDTGDEATSPPLSLHYENGVLKIIVIHSDSDPVTPESEIRERVFKQPHFTQEKWHDFVFQIHWANNDTGMVRIWMDGNLIVNYHGPVGYNDEEGPYFKFGVYRDEEYLLDETENDPEPQQHFPATDPYTIYHDDYRRGLTASDVL